MRALLLKAWLRPLVVGLSIILGFSGGSWATMRWLSASSETRIETLAALNVEIERARETLAEIEETSWGVTLREIDGERFAAPPGGALADPPWTVGGLPALKLSNEGGSSMTELEGQQTAALERLSAQFEMEQRRHGEQVEALQQRVERLTGQVTRLAQDYRTLAATLRGRWT